MKFNKYLIALACAFTTAAHADGNFYILGSLGQTSFDASKSDFDDGLNSEGFTVLSSKVDDSDNGYKLQFGYQFNPNFALEGGYVDLGELSYRGQVIYSGVPMNLDQKVEAEGWNIDAVGILPIGNNFSLFAKAGVIDAKVKLKVRASVPGFSASESTSSTDIKPLFGVGAAYAIGSVSIRAEFERYSNLGDEDKTGEGDVDLLSVGVSYKF